VSFEFLVQKLPDQFPVPPFWMVETRIKGKVPFIKGFCFHPLGFGPIGRHIEYGKIQETNAIVMSNNKIKGPSCFYQTFRGSSKKKVDIGGHPCPFQILKS